MSRKPAPEWTSGELRILKHLTTPWRIQSYLNRLPYNDQPSAMSPRRVMRERTAHCFEGALFAAAALRFLGHEPLIVDMAARNDDDHVMAVFRVHGLWGAIAKSNTTMLRFREPVYRTMRELVMSYFEMYFNTRGVKSLWSYSRPVNLARYDRRGWMTSETDLDHIGDHLYAVSHIDVVPPGQRRMLSPADRDVVRACFLESRKSGLFRPK